MSVENALAFLRDHHRAVLITRKADGGLQSSPIAAGVDAEGRVVVSTRRQLAKARNVARDPAVSLCVVADEWWGPWTHVDGTATIVDGDEGVEGLVDYYRRVSGEHPDWDEYRAAMVADGRVLLRIAVTHAAGPAAD